MGVRERQNGSVLITELKMETPNQMLFKNLKIAYYKATVLQHNQEKVTEGMGA